MTRAMQSSVLVAVAQVTFPELWLLHCWHLRCSSGPTAHHTTCSRRFSTSADAAQRDTMVNRSPESCEGHSHAADLDGATAPLAQSTFPA